MTVMTSSVSVGVAGLCPSGHVSWIGSNDLFCFADQSVFL